MANTINHGVGGAQTIVVDATGKITDAALANTCLLYTSPSPRDS